MAKLAEQAERYEGTLHVFAWSFFFRPPIQRFAPNTLPHPLPPGLTSLPPFLQTWSPT